MPNPGRWGSVKIRGQDGRAIYVNGDYTQPAGVAPGPLVVAFTFNFFDTLDGLFRIDNRGYAEPTLDNPDLEIDLAPVVPPARTSRTPPDGDAANAAGPP